MEAWGHAIVLFSAASDRGRWVLVVLLSVGRRAVSLTVLAEEQLTAVPATTRPAEPASPCLACLRRPRFHFSIRVALCSGAPRLAPTAGRRELVKSSKSTDVQRLPLSHSTDSDGLGMEGSHEKFIMPLTLKLSLHASLRPHEPCATGTPPRLTDWTGPKMLLSAGGICMNA